MGALSKINKYTISIKLVDAKSGKIIIAEQESANDKEDLERAIYEIGARLKNTCIEWDKKRGKDFSEEKSDKTDSRFTFSLATRYNCFFEADLPKFKLPGEFTIDPGKTDICFLSEIISPSFGITDYIDLKTNIIFSHTTKFKIKSQHEQSDNNEFNYGVYIEGKNLPFYGFGFEELITLKKPHKIFIPFISLGVGYQLFVFNEKPDGDFSFHCEKKSDPVYHYPSQSYNFSFDRKSHLVYLAGELGFNVFIYKSIGLTFSLGCNWAIKQKMISNIKIKLKDSYNIEDMPDKYKDLDQKLEIDSGSNLPPAVFAQFGIIYRF